MAIASTEEWPPLLPWGLHPMSLAALRNLCVDRFPDSITRPVIMDGLEEVIKTLNGIAFPLEAWVDGSFLTEKLNPEDSDVVVKVDGPSYRMATVQQKMALGWLNTDLKAQFHCDSYIFAYYPPDHPAHDGEQDEIYWRAKFGFSRKDAPKGLALLKLPFFVT